MLKIGDFAKIFGITIKTVRYYESIGLIVPGYIDIYTGYRYFNDENIKRMEEILSLKELGFSLEEIKNFKMSEIKNKIEDYERKMLNIKEQIYHLKELSFKGKEVLKMRKFIHDERVIGKWELLGVASSLEMAKNKEFVPDDYQIKELYLLPLGKQYWVISWRKDIIYINGKENSYQIINNKMYLTIKGEKEGEFKIATYKKVDSKEYSKEEIKIKDNIEVEYIEDKNLVGFWKVIDFVNNPISFNPEKIQSASDNLPLSKVTFTPDGEVYINYKYNETTKHASYTKDYIINFCLPDTLSKYSYQTINNKKYLIIEWKSGDYVYGRIINGYYVLEKISQKTN